MSEAYQPYLAAILSGSRQSAYAVLEERIDAGETLASIYIDVLQPSMREIGRLWQEDEISVADEHLATAITQWAMGRLYDRYVADAARSGGPTLIAACADSERHEVGLRMLCDLMELEGWDTVYLGASVPVESLVAMVEKRRPAVVALSATIAPHLPQLRAMVEAVRKARVTPAPRIVVGGRPFLDRPELSQQVGADMSAEDAISAVRQIKQWQNGGN